MLIQHRHLPNRYFTTTRMAKSKFEYVREFESDVKILPQTWIVVRVDGKGFHKFANLHDFNKPNDVRALDLMNRAAISVMKEFRDIVLGFGQSDEYSFVFRKETYLYNRRESKIVSYVNSLFTSSYVFYWTKYFGDVQLIYPPSFDARVILYPTDTSLRDYLSWRQADVHVNNLYNTAFWNLVLKGGLTNSEAEKRLSGTLASDKNELLFSEFNINYNNEPVIFRKGTILLRKKIRNAKHNKLNHVIYPVFEDLIQNKFWKNNSEIMDFKNTPEYECVGDLPQLVEEQLDKINNKLNAESIS